MGRNQLERIEPPKARLVLEDLARRHWGVPPAVAAYYAQAAHVCLDRHHQSPVDFQIVNGENSVEATMEWPAVDDRTRGAFAYRDSIEDGAYACALAAVDTVVGLVAVHRADSPSGADYYVAPVGASVEDLENCLRLEVSGVDRGSKKDVERRLKDKLDQAARGQSNLPAIAGVVGFCACLILFSRLGE